MQWFTCGSSRPIPPDIFSKFDGVIANYFWSLESDCRPSVFDFSEGKIVRSHFLYGNTHQAPPKKTGCQTLEEWVEKLASRFPHVDEWVIVNEFTGIEKNTYYPGYSPEEIIKYCQVVHRINPKAKLIIADFKPWMVEEKWLALIKTVVELGLKNNLPIELGIQTHIKTINAPTVLLQLQRILKAYKDLCPVHFIEASVWHNSEVDRMLTNMIWNGLVEIGLKYNVASFCPWWLNEVDEETMPSFENFKGGSIFDKDWNLKVTDKVLPFV